MKRLFALVLALAALGCGKKPMPGPPCAMPIPSTVLYEVYCDVVNRVFCLSPQYEDI